MRGKLRDKPANIKRDRLKRELVERRRPSRRESRSATLFNQQLEDEYQSLDDGEPPVALEQQK
ncbi:MAG TPA: hypothetical protein VFA09_16480 [Ktedonobacteraceae bacterium]|nr:hypothetical protein [Ktedonobacteraceae bacterium]